MTIFRCVSDKGKYILHCWHYRGSKPQPPEHGRCQESTEEKQEFECCCCNAKRYKTIPRDDFMPD